MSQQVNGTGAPTAPQAKLAAVEIGRAARVYAWAATTVALLVGFYLAMRNFNGVGTASVFAVAFLFGIVALGGILPAAVKVGDVEVMLQNAKQEGRAEGKAEGTVQAVTATAQVAALQREPDEVVAQLGVPEDVRSTVKEALDVVQQAATTDPHEWQNAVAARPTTTGAAG
jgi:hypothetical protein